MTIRDMLNTANSEQYITATELALLVRLAPKTIYRHILRNAIPGVIHIGRRVRINRRIALHYYHTMMARDARGREGTEGA